jgi:hypothetical protein
MNFDSNDAVPEKQNIVHMRMNRDARLLIASSKKNKVKIVDDRVWCQKIPHPIPAITSFSLPRGWEETQKPSGSVPGQHGHRYHPKDNMKVLLRFWCSGIRATPDQAELMRKLFYEKGTLPDLEDPALASLVDHATNSKLIKVTAAKLSTWNGRPVLECEYTADAADEAAFDNSGVKELKCWSLVYDNAESTDPKVCVPLPASIEFIAEEHAFKTNLQTVEFAVKSILWNNDWPPKE